MRVIKTVAFALFLGLLWLAPGPLAAQDAQALSQRLERLERDIQTLSKMVVRGPGAVSAAEVPASAGASGGAGNLPANAVARIGVRLDSLESDLRDVTGRIEELAFNLGQLTQRVDRLVADVDFRLTGLEQQARPMVGTQGAPAAPAAAPGEPASSTEAAGLSGQGAGAAPLPQRVQIVGQTPRSLGQVEADRVAPVDARPAPGAVSGAGDAQAMPGQVPAVRPSAPVQSATAVQVPGGTPWTAAPAQAAPRPTQQASLPAGTPEEQYRYAFGLLRKHQFDQAEGAFREFLAQNAESSLVGNARYWLAETHYARAEYVKAAEGFLQGYESDPNGSKAPDSLLKLAMSLGQLGQEKEACGAIAKLFADYPNANPPLKRTATRQQRQLNCK